MAGEVVVPIARDPRDYDGLVCECGSAWFTTAVCCSRDARVTGHTELCCTDCGQLVIA